MITISSKGNFSATEKFLKKQMRLIDRFNLDKYGKEGCRALSNATPKDDGVTASSWYYEIEKKKGKATIVFKNSNINDGVPIAIILQYGHATKNGGWVEGIDYINPALKPIFERLTNEAFREVSRT